MLLAALRAAGCFEDTCIDANGDGYVVVGGSSLPRLSLQGQLDTRTLDLLIDPAAEEGATGELLASLGVACTACNDGSGPYCVDVDIRLLDTNLRAR